MADIQQKGMKGLGKMGDKFEGKPDPAKKMGGEMHGEDGDSSKTVIEHHADGTHSVDGEQHPDHLAALTAVAHKVTGGDKHHMVHHDGMSANSHTVHEDGQHEDHGDQDPHGALDKFMGDGQEGEDQPMEQMGEDQHEPAYGGM